MATEAAPTTTATTTNTPKIRRPARIEKNHVVGLLGLMAFLDLIVLALAGYALDKIIDGTLHRLNGATYHLALTSLVAGLLTLAAIISGFFHYKHYNSGSVSSASTTALIAWAVTLLAFGLACKQADLGHEGSKMRALEAFVILLTIFETIYMLMLHVGLSNSKYGVGY